MSFVSTAVLDALGGKTVGLVGRHPPSVLASIPCRFTASARTVERMASESDEQARSERFDPDVQDPYADGVSRRRLLRSSTAGRCRRYDRWLSRRPVRRRERDAGPRNVGQRRDQKRNGEQRNDRRRTAYRRTDGG
jgi:hypothetical protein